MSKHTPGTWIVLPTQHDHGKSLCVQTENIGDILAVCEGPYSENDRANLTLMAAAPELLAALEGLAKRFGKPESEAEKIARAAIAKARGEG